MQEKLISEFAKLVNKKEAVITSQVYLEICEIKRYHDVTYSFNSLLNKICITAKKTKNGPTCAFIAIPVNEELNFFKIQNIIKSVLHKMIFVVIVESDSTTVYYQLAEDLLEPTDTSAKHLKENKQEKLDNSLKRNRQLLEHGALLGLQVTLKWTRGLYFSKGTLKIMSCISTWVITNKS